MKTVRNKAGYITIALHVLIWSMLLLLPYFVSTQANQYKIGPLPGLFFTIAGFIHIGIFYGNAFYLYPKLWNRRYWWLYILSLPLLLALAGWLKHAVLVAWFPHVLNDVTAYKFVFAPSFGILVISIVYRALVNKIRFEKEQKEKKAQQLFTELKFLRSQISPHFLFNVLTNLVSLARKKSDQLEPSLIMLADLMRYMLYDTRERKVVLKKEIDYLNSYIELQKLRFGKEVQIHTRLQLQEGSAEQYTIEPMLLIPFVENAFKHGIGIPNPGIDIQLSLANGQLVFEVINGFNKELDTSKDDGSGIGLDNVRSRLNLLYQHRHRLSISNANNLFHITLILELT